MGVAAYHSLAGKIVRTIEPHSEADPVALLLQFLTCFGNMIGRSCYVRRTRARQHGNLFVALVGASAIARKGTAFEDLRDTISYAAPTWAQDRMHTGLSSGEGLLFMVRDPIMKWDKNAEDYVEIDHGVEDKRLLSVETEFASLLAVMQRGKTQSHPGYVLLGMGAGSRQ
jgi:hypothetical protein